MTVLKVEHLSQNFGGLHVLHDLSFSLEAGEKAALIGPNGAGKTTLLNDLSGFLHPVTGSIHLLGHDITNLHPHERVSIGLSRSFQISTLMPKLSLLTNVLLSIQGIKKRRFQMIRPFLSYKDDIDKAQELLELVGLWEERNSPIIALSHGQQRQVEIILAMASKPKVLLMDEPNAGLTTEESMKLIKMIRDLLKDTAVLLSAHDMDLVFGLADRVLVLYYGEIIAQGKPQEIQGNLRVREIYLGTGEKPGNA